MNRKAPRNVPFFDWNNRPSPVGRQGLIIGINPINVYSPEIVMISNGSYWKPINSKCTIATVLDSSAYTGDTSEYIASQVLLPTNFLLEGDIVFIESSVRKTGTADTVTTRIRVGSTGTLSDPSITTMGPISATTLSLGFRKNLRVVTGPAVRQQGAATAHDPYTGTSNSATFPSTIPALNTPIYMTVSGQLNTIGSDSVEHQFTNIFLWRK